MNSLMVEFLKGISSNFKVDENINMNLKFLNIFESFGTGLKSFELSELRKVHWNFAMRLFTVPGGGLVAARWYFFTDVTLGVA